MSEMSKHELLSLVVRDINWYRERNYICYTCLILQNIVVGYGLNKKIIQSYALWLTNSPYFKSKTVGLTPAHTVIHVTMGNWEYNNKLAMFQEFLEQYTGEI